MSTNKTSPKFGIGFLAFILIVVIAVGYLAINTQKDSELKLVADSSFDSATILPEAKPLSPLNLIDQNNATFTLDNLKGKWSFLFFGYTSCPDICPVEMATLRQMTQHLSKDEQPQVALVSIDPETDTPERLKAYLKGFSDDFVGLTGPIPEIERFAKELSIFHKKETTPRPSGEMDHSQHNHANHSANADGEMDHSQHGSHTPKVEISHSGSYILISPDAKYYAILSAPHDAKRIAETFKKIIKNTN